MAEKERIAKAALDELPEDGAILLDAGTTTIRLAEMLPTDRELTVVTNALPIATLLADPPGDHAALRRRTGARAHPRRVDDWAVRALARPVRRRRLPRHERAVRRARADHPRPG